MCLKNRKYQNQKNSLKTLILLFSLLGIIGCEHSQKKIEISSWQPNNDEIKKAEEIAKTFAFEILGVNKDILNRIKFRAYGLWKDNNKLISLEFFDPEHFPNWEDIAVISGGFPHYFRIEINISDWKIIHYYAELQ